MCCDQRGVSFYRILGLFFVISLVLAGTGFLTSWALYALSRPSTEGRSSGVVALLPLEVAELALVAFEPRSDRESFFGGVTFSFCSWA